MPTPEEDEAFEREIRRELGEHQHRLKKPILAAFLGLIGPLGAIYFGWRVLVTTLIVFFAVTLFVTWAIPFSFPHWYPWCVSLFFAFWNYQLARLHNAAQAEQGGAVSLAAMNLIGMEGWYIRFSVGVMSVYSGFMLIREGRYWAAVATVFLLAPLAILFFEWIAGMLLGLLVTILDRYR